MEFWDGFRSKVENEIREILDQEGGTPHALSTMFWYQMGFCDERGKFLDLPKGKYMRPVLCLAMCAALGGNPDGALPAAASLELIHRDSLIFDDIQDKGTERNQRKTLWAIWGITQTLNAGLALTCFARLALLRMRQRNVSSDVILKISGTLERAVIELCWGQYRDISMMDSLNVALMDYLQMVRGKTSALFAAACKVGAICAGADEKTIAEAGEFGLNIGLAFQMHDDYLGVWGDEAEVGKTANDLMEKKRALPLVLAMQADPQATRNWLKIKHISPEAVAVFRRWMENREIPSKIKMMESEYITDAQTNLRRLNLSSEWFPHLNQFLSFVTERTK